MFISSCTLIQDMFIAGTDTTSATLEWVMTELALHPRVLKKAQEEMRQIAGNKGKVEENDIHQFRYIRSVIKETLRLHPPLPLLVPRESMEDCVVNGFDIPAKTRVFVNIYAIGRDPEIWQQPLEFNPERFEGTETDVKGQDFELLPFGGGRRGCPGNSFAMATVETALARLLYHFDWKLQDGVDAGDVDMSEVFGLTTKKRTPLILVATRNQEFGFKA
ncbi:uncharacterized protein A4U43_UnF10140 [Asparagus officinalis]|uniref:Cytochrome P450 n=1 Tax=Asparagus officinalis TaxID=4686 RepID=A0A1R3L5J1_ASPOF|nr:cytochrome P450 71A1-like [Asparagus officinalis]ONK54875.1 uncharacterized protein A4U43_UnF10140 [Asparagus officinalis]